MVRQWFFIPGSAAMALAVVLWAAESGRAQHAGGGHAAGGFHGSPAAGGFHGSPVAGGFHGSPQVYHGTPGAYHGAYRYGTLPGHHGGYPYRYAYPHHHARYYPWLGLGLYPSVYAAPLYSGLYSSFYPDYDPDFVYVPEPPAPAPSFTVYPPIYTGPPVDRSAHLQIRVPEDAQIWFDGEKTDKTGTLRQFVSPPLDPGRDYAYDVRARWTEDGREVDRSERVTVRAGQQVWLNLLIPPAASKQ